MSADQFCGKYLAACQFMRNINNLNTYYNDITIGTFKCGDDDFLKMMSKVTDLGIWFFAMPKEIVTFLTPPNYRIALEYFWQGSAGGINAWIAYTFAMIYYLIKETSFAIFYCKMFAVKNGNKLIKDAG